MKLADRMRERSREALRIIEEDSKIQSQKFVQGELREIIEKWADEGARTMRIPDGLKGYKPRVGEVVSDPAIGTYLTYGFGNSYDHEILLFRDIKKALEAEGFEVGWNEVCMPYLQVNW